VIKPSSDIDMYSTDLDIIVSSLIDPSPPQVQSEERAPPIHRA
jgi:hypothetical protein